MELFLFRPAEYDKLYNCSGIVVDAIPLENRRFVIEAWLTIILCAVYYILYIPCLISIWRHVSENTCYKLLFFIGIMDLAMLWIIGFLHGWLSLNGAVFCSYPTLIYITGAISISGWIIESSADLILAIERCLEFVAPKISNTLFRGRRCLIWIGIICLYGAVVWLFEKPFLFNGIFFAWVFNPFAGYRQVVNVTYENIFHAIHDIIIGILMPLFYGAFVIVLWVKWANVQSRISFEQKMVFLQVFLISAMNIVACSGYICMQFIQVGQWVITLSQFAWLHIHGFPPVIYLLLNKTIRHDCRKMFYKVFDPKRIKHIYGITILIKSNHQPMNQVLPS